MAAFKYRALDKNGDQREGLLRANDRAAAIAALQADGLHPLQVEEGGAEAWPTPARFRGIRSAKYCANLFGGLATLVEAGLPLDQALAAFADIAAGDTSMQPTVLRLHEQLRRGSDLAQALAAESGFGPGFEPLAIGMVAAGQTSGDMAGALNQLARLYERRQRNSAALRSALIYPAVLLVVTLLVLALLLSYVIPQFEAMFRDARHELPVMTQFVFGLAGGLGQALWLLALLGLAAIPLWRQARRDPDRARRIDAALLRLPIVGPLFKGLEGERIGFVLAGLLAAGVTLPDAVRHTADTLRNEKLAADLRMAAEKLRQGSGLAAALGPDIPLPPLLLRLMALGEAGSALPATMRKAADWLERDSETRLRRLVALLEPAMVVILGALIAVVMVAVLSAIVDLNRLPL
ncbi:type II secretion system F family protein [Ferrovibrio sp.]|uniref:type II secretion system F family protein n=1 Tax=Ferrovibrio sp. TaxID=1917215 RepID=UPI0035B4C07D